PAGPGWKVNIGDGSNRVDLETGGAIADNEWHTLSATFDRDGLVSMYEDGVFMGSDDISGIGNINTGTGLFFGADNLGAYQFSGSIAEVRVWNEVLTSTEISDWSCQEVNGSHPSSGNLIGHWKMNEGSGESTVPDYSGNNNTGTQVNTIWSNPSSYYEDDYSNTPRLVDLPFTALDHLCIEAKPEWEFEGQSLAVECDYSPMIFDSFNGFLTAEMGTSYSWYIDGGFIAGASSIDFTPNQGGLVTAYIVNDLGTGAMSNGINWGVVGGVLGCTNPNADNYNPNASLDDGSCVGIEDNTCVEDLNQDGIISAADLLQLLSAFGSTCD
ncbi:MAG: LamG-like jellyroll fold domain-containing protein, partial [Flavobacteriales bacterium]